ncbi:hypothetical protein E2C01_004140 [Portunus trituberculatus]|uniref:Uncharacterized protein n=1 Tax=Portunus trituberculatus TaxID=210409 RepID=A0A5B7CS35_PORTR|nr:hypothetical protein [Portunus trituberculatus]
MDYLMMKRWSWFQAREERASIIACATSGNSSSMTHRSPDSMTRSPRSGQMFRAITCAGKRKQWVPRKQMR